MLVLQKAQPASKEDVGIGQDLFDTLRANHISVGMAANMIEFKTHHYIDVRRDSCYHVQSLF